MLSYSCKNLESKRLPKRINSADVPGVTSSTRTVCIGVKTLLDTAEQPSGPHDFQLHQAHVHPTLDAEGEGH